MALLFDVSIGSILLCYRKALRGLCVLLWALLEHAGTCGTAEEVALAFVVCVHFRFGRFLHVHHHGGHNCALDHGVDRAWPAVVFGVLCRLFLELRRAASAAEVVTTAFVVSKKLVFGRLFNVRHMALVDGTLDFALGLSEGKRGNRNSNDSEESSLHVSIVTHEWGKRYFLNFDHNADSAPIAAHKRLSR